MNAESTTGTPATRPAATGMPRKLSVAVTTAAIPAVMMSALALAEPAAAAPVSPQNTLFPQLPLQAIKNLNTGAVTGVAASQLATQVPATLAAESSVPATHRIAAGDTVTFPGREPHSWRNPDTGAAAVVIWTLVSPGSA